MSGRPQKPALGRESILRKRSNGCTGPPAPSTFWGPGRSGTSGISCFLSPYLRVWKHFANGKQNDSSDREQRGKGTDGGRLSLTLDKPIRFLQVPGCSLQRATGPRSGRKSGMQRGLPTPSRCALISSYKRRAQWGAGQPFWGSALPGPHHAGQIWGRTELAEKLCLLLPKSRILLETPTYNGGCVRTHTHRWPQGIFIFSNPNPASDAAAKRFPPRAPPTRGDAGAAHCAPQAF